MLQSLALSLTEDSLLAFWPQHFSAHFPHQQMTSKLDPLTLFICLHVFTGRFFLNMEGF